MNSPLRKARTIVVAGYYGFGNAGDELILRSLIEQMRSQDPERDITVFSAHPEETRRAFGVEAVDRWHPWEWIKPLGRADLFILGGGGLLQETTGTWNHFYYLFSLVMAKLLGCRTEVHGIGVDPMENGFNRWQTRFVCNFFVDRLSVRDADSQHVLENAGVHHPVLQMADPVFRLKLPPMKGEKPSLGIGLALSPWPRRLGWDHDVALMADRLIEQLDTTLELLVFFPEQDEALARKVARLTNDRVTVRVWERPEELLEWIQRYELVVGMRYHALVLAALAEKPFVGWGSQRKVRSLCTEMSQPLWSFERGWDPDAVLRQIGEAWRQRASLPDRYRLRLSPMKSLLLDRSPNFYSKTAL